MSATNITYFGFIPGYVIFWGVTLLAAGFFLNRIFQLRRYMFLGKKPAGFGETLKRGFDSFWISLTQWCQLKNLTAKDRASIGHALMFWGFVTFVFFYFLFIILGAGFGLSESLEHTRFFFYYAWVMDIMAVLVVTGAGWGIIRRYVVRPERLATERTFEAIVILGSVFFHPITHLFKEATSIALGHPPVGLGAALPPVSSALSSIFSGSPVGTVETASIWFFWAHWLTVLFVLVIIPYTRYFHVMAAPINIFFKAAPPKGVLSKIDIETAENFGLSRITDLTWKQILDLYTCVICNNCQEQCPATATGKPLNPRKIIQDLKMQLLDVAPRLIKAKDDAAIAEINPENSVAGKVLAEDEVWACTTCRACDEVCPLWVEHIDKIVEARRNLVMEQSNIPETAEGALRSIEDRGHPWRGTTATRTDWTEGLDVKTLADDSDVDVLYWVGCTSALEERSTRVARAVAKVLQSAGVKFGILGDEESCCGDPARRLGNEYLFQMVAESNIEILKRYNIKEIVTSCPHCYQVIKNEYPQFGGNFEVTHHTEFIAQLFEEKKLSLVKGPSGTVTYHDSCYLGRYNDIYRQPREILGNMPGVRVVEMENNRSRSFCCGGGGGRMWLEERIGTRISEQRTEEAIKAGAEIIATACPFCLQMFDDALKAKGVAEKMKVKDLAELVAESELYQP
ncbi:MAG: (Fe-S)-binding protein [Dehalococcoidales bacterium]|nr:(Fe-S)-binding protein [Dehalococcoidales bacterium]